MTEHDCPLPDPAEHELGTRWRCPCGIEYQLRSAWGYPTPYWSDVAIKKN